jgi:hypothetical protein
MSLSVRTLCWLMHWLFAVLAFAVLSSFPYGCMIL